jgi:hypothetical protein
MHIYSYETFYVFIFWCLKYVRAALIYALLTAGGIAPKIDYYIFNIFIVMHVMDRAVAMWPIGHCRFMFASLMYSIATWVFALLSVDISCTNILNYACLI